jgi:hypothetical protein
MSRLAHTYRANKAPTGQQLRGQRRRVYGHSAWRAVNSRKYTPNGARECARRRQQIVVSLKKVDG